MDKETVNSLVSEAQHIAENAGNLIMTFFDELAEEDVEYNGRCRRSHRQERWKDCD